MIVALNWLKEFVDINVEPEKLAELLTNSGNEVEEIIYQDRFLHNVVVGKILKIERHPNAEKLVICQVDIGSKITQIITAATNVKENDIVPVALPGADLANNIHIEASKLRGIESDGMFCSIEELGVTDYDGEVNGIMILDNDAVIGEPIANALLMNDVIFDVNVTANRPDCMSILGIAREISALLGTKVKEPDLSYNVDTNDNISSYLSVDINNEELCPRYIAIAVKDIKIEKSPKWLRARLVSVGIKPINNIVDITNYVLTEYGQPMHAFDYKYLEGKKIIVRNAVKGEKIEALNQNTYELDENMLCVCDAQKPVVIAGIIGGLNSCVQPDTKTAIFESASFERSSIRKTGRRIGVRTDSTARFEKGVDLGSPMCGMERALSLISKLKAGTIVCGKIDTLKKDISPKTLEFSLSRIMKLLGLKVENDKVLSILNNLGLKSTINGDVLTTVVPVYRFDIENDADVAEEIIRMYGYDAYDKLNAEPLSNATVTVGKYDEILQNAREIKDELCCYGYDEIVNYSLCAENVKDKLLLGKDDYRNNMIRIANPISEDLAFVRTTLANSMFTTVARNLARKNTEFRFFESGRVYLPKKLPLEELPNEENYISFSSVCVDDDFFTLKGIIENILSSYNVKYHLEYSSCPFLHPGISADIFDNNILIGSFGLVHPKVCKNFEILNHTLYAEINLDKLVKYGKKVNFAKSLSKFPAVDRDLAVVCDEKTTIENIMQSVEKSCGNLFLDAKVFDIYRNEALGVGKKSVAFSFRLQPYDKTLVDEEINKIVQKVLKDLKYKCGAELR